MPDIDNLDAQQEQHGDSAEDGLKWREYEVVVNPTRAFTQQRLSAGAYHSGFACDYFKQNEFTPHGFFQFKPTN